MRLSEVIETSGLFWLPEKPEDQLPGNLHISDSGETTLELLGLFGDPLTAINDVLSAENSCVGRILGVVEKGGPVTLDECLRQNTNLRLFGGLSKLTFSPRFAFMGVNYEEGEIVTFTKFTVSVEGLDEWLAISGINVDWEFDSNSASITIRLPGEISLNLPDGIGLSFHFSMTFPSRGITITEAGVSQKAFVSLESEEPRPIEYFSSLALKLCNFLRLAVDQDVAIDSITGYSTELTRESGSGDKHEVPIKVYYQSVPRSEVKREIHRHTILFDYPSVADQLEQIFIMWLESYEAFEPAFSLYFASSSNDHQYLEVEFLQRAQGIETLHRRSHHSTEMPQDEFRELLDSVLRTCPIDRRTWLRGKLHYSNEFSLRQRLEAMTGPFQHFFGASKARKAFIRKVVDTRNYLTHYDSELESRAATGQDLWELTMKLEALFQLHLLQIVGLDTDRIDSIVQGHSSLKRRLGI